MRPRPARGRPGRARWRCWPRRSAPATTRRRGARCSPRRERAAALAGPGDSARARASLAAVAARHGAACSAGAAAGAERASARPSRCSEPAGPLRDDPHLRPWLALGRDLPARGAAPAATLVDHALEPRARRAAVGVLPFAAAPGRPRPGDDATGGRARRPTYREGDRGWRARRASRPTWRCARRARLAARRGRAATTSAARTPRRPRRSAARWARGCRGCGRLARWASWSSASATRPARGRAAGGAGRPAARRSAIADVDLSPAPGARRGAAAAGRRDGGARRPSPRCSPPARGQGPAVGAGPGGARRGLAGGRRPRRRASPRRWRCTRARPTPSSTARTRLAYGARLRRARARASTPASRCARRSDAFERARRRPLGRAARAPSSRRPARPLRRRDRRAASSSRPQELQIALLLADGRTTREAAARALPQPEDDRVPPAQRLPQARHPLARGARGRGRRRACGRMSRMEHRQLGRSGLRVSVLCPRHHDLRRRAASSPTSATTDVASGHAPDRPLPRRAASTSSTPPTSTRAACPRRSSAQALEGRRDRIVLATKARLPMGDGPNDAGLSRRHLIARVRGQPAAARDGPHRPLPGARVGRPDAARGDARRARHARALGQGPLRRLLELQPAGR